MEKDDVWFLLGRVKDDAHMQRLAEVASWLDQNKFSCTFSVRGELGCFDITPHKPHTAAEYDNFPLYAAELAIVALAKALGEDRDQT